MVLFLKRSGPFREIRFRDTAARCHERGIGRRRARATAGYHAGVPDDTRQGSGPEPAGQRFVVCGNGALARRLVTELTDRYGAAVTVVLPSLTDSHAPDIAEFGPQTGATRPRPRLVVAPRLTAEVLARARVRDAAAVALVGDDDVTNVDSAMIVRELAPDVRLVVRLFNPVLGEGVATMLGDCAVLSGSEIAAPAFVAAALGEDAPTYLRLRDDELVRTAGRATLDPTADIVCGLADTTGSEAVTLPADEPAADLVLVRMYGRRRREPPRRRRRLLRTAGLVFGRNLRLALAAMVALFVVGSALLAYARGLNPAEAGYLTLLTAMGGADADPAAPLVEKATVVVLAIAGAALLPTITALLVDSLVHARLAVAAGGLTDPVENHVVVVGLGNIGTRVIEELHSLGIEVVAVDRAESARGVAVARGLGLPVIVGDATRPETLRAASVRTCRALVVLTSDDVTNLETALTGRSAHRAHPTAPGAAVEPLRVVLRLFDDGFAERVQRTFGIHQSRSVSYLAAPAFAAAMMGRQVIDTISVGRRVLLVADLPVGAGSDIEGRYCGDLSRPGSVRVIAMRTGRADQTIWSLPERRPLVRTDRLIVVATRAGLAALLPRTVPSADPPPLAEAPPMRLLGVPPVRSSGHPAEPEPA
ncbi:Trk K+ transport system, NAD-binding component [Micromonospora narathiwatensis]|uniref:Trk K+ transport system, NAD-binding component n=1 Tax=Micromonospora narathiwatensis TaxID=299146 RepID=A0A1A8ZR07_9ACTN|nr:Trk K+ transport system, NAD-binding component [Micromonospora narathiwatensis]